MTLAFLLAVPLALIRSTRGFPPFRWVASIYVEVIRGTPLLLQLFYVYYVMPAIGVTLSPVVAGTIALGVNYSAYLSEVFRGGIQAIEKAQWESAEVLNLPARAVWGHVVLPQALRISIPGAGNYVVSMFKDTALCATISVSELLFTGQNIGAETFQYVQIYSVVFFIYLAITYPASRGVRWLEGHLRIDAR